MYKKKKKKKKGIQGEREKGRKYDKRKYRMSIT